MGRAAAAVFFLVLTNCAALGYTTPPPTYGGEETESPSLLPIPRDGDDVPTQQANAISWIAVGSVWLVGGTFALALAMPLAAAQLVGAGFSSFSIVSSGVVDQSLAPVFAVLPIGAALLGILLSVIPPSVIAIAGLAVMAQGRAMWRGTVHGPVAAAPPPDNDTFREGEERRAAARLRRIQEEREETEAAARERGKADADRQLQDRTQRIARCEELRVMEEVKTPEQMQDWAECQAEGLVTPAP